MTKLLFILLILLSFSAHAQYWTSHNNFTASTVSSQDSTVIISGEIEKDVKWIWINETKDGQEMKLILPAGGDSHFRAKLYLRMGAGKYSIKILYSKNEIKYSSYYEATTLNVENVDPRENIDALEPTELIQSDDSEIVDLKDSIIAGLQTDLEKTKAIHDWVAGHIAYDVEMFLSGVLKEEDLDALTTVQKKKSVCEGYANLTVALNRAAGIPARLVIGEGITGAEAVFKGKANHAWNEVLIDGKWMIQDTTWDAGFVDFASKKFTFKLQQKYFNPDPAKFALDHKPMP
jgi:hypothetical protein